MHVACSSSFSNLPRAKPQLLAKSRLTIQDSTKWRLNSNVLFPNSPLRTGLLVYCLIDWAIRNVYVYIYIYMISLFTLYMYHIMVLILRFLAFDLHSLRIFDCDEYAFGRFGGGQGLSGQIASFTTLVFQKCPQCTAMLVSFFFSMKAVKISADMLRQAWNWAIFSNSATHTNTVNQALGTQSSPDGKAIKTVSTIEREQLEVDFAKRVLWDLINRGRHVDASWIIFWSRSHGSCRNFETLGIYQIYPNLHWQEKLTQMATIAFLRRRTSWCVINW